MKNKETYWSRFADDFEERNNFVVGKDDMDIMLKTVSNQKDLGNVLELACGNGTFSKELIKNATSLLATDFSDEMVSASTVKLNKFENIKVEKANAFNLTYPKEHFDSMFMANLLHVVPNPEDIVVESEKLLKLGGKIIILDFGMEGVSAINKAKMVARYLKTYGKPPADGKKLTVKSIVEILTSNGFNIEKSELIGNKMKAAFVIGVKKIS